MNVVMKFQNIFFICEAENLRKKYNKEIKNPERKKIGQKQYENKNFAFIG